MDISAEMNQKQDALMEELVRKSKRPDYTSEEEQRQFLRGYFSLVVASSTGNNQPRDEYLESIIPATKAAGMSLSYIIATLNLVHVVTARRLSEEAATWFEGFSTDYAERLIDIWERS